MIGIIVQLALSWILAWYFEKKDLSVLGFRPTISRMVDLVVFLFVAICCCTLMYVLRRYFGKEEWISNPNYSFNALTNAAWVNIKSVLFEELIFRGVLLYILMRRIGVGKAILASAISFGVYHWFSYGVFGSIMPMIQVFIFTGMAGMIFAYGYTQTGSLYAPIGMHFGWNFTQQFIFSEGFGGQGIISLVKPVNEVQVSYAIYYLVSLSPMIVFLGLNYLLLRYWKRPVPQYGKINIE